MKKPLLEKIVKKLPGSAQTWDRLFWVAVGSMITIGLLSIAGQLG